MISIEESRKALGKLGKKLSDKEIENLRNSLYQIISDLLDHYYESEQKPEK